ncbi:type II secretion system F family protein [Variovorax sp. RHLX14]|uniref:type II secretion system F family protein n=1 Tax=Variovorax sp. RHLX14 TaxID=1259731 RepID=UPI003F488349
MPDAFFVAAILALLVAAAALLLWQWAARRQARDAAGRFLAQQIAAHGTGGGLAADGSAAEQPRQMTDPWAPAPAGPANSANSANAARTGWAPIELPGRLQGVITLRTLAISSIVVLAASIAMLAAAGALPAVTAFVLLALAGTFALWLRLQKRRRRMVAQLPGFIDGMVRLLTVGNATQAAFQLSVDSAKAPLREPLEDAAALARAGVDLDLALHQTARDTGIDEMALLASIVGVGVRYGGRTDLLLERVAGFMRDREQAEQELIALSSETRLSAWVLGLLPMIVAGIIVMTNASYFLRMWQDPTGQTMIFGAAGLQMIGVLMLYRLARIG